MDVLLIFYGFVMGFLDFRLWNLTIIENLEKNYEKYRKFEELRHMDAPVLRKLENCLDRIAAERMLPGKT